MTIYNLCGFFSRVLEFRRTPLAVGRRINLKLEIIPVASEKLLKTFYTKGIYYFQNSIVFPFLLDYLHQSLPSYQARFQMY